MTNRINEFLQLVTNHIQSKEAKQFVSDELKQHLNNTTTMYINKGMLKEEAEQLAIYEMGSPVTLGLSLNKVHKPKIDWLLITLVTAILFISFLPIITLSTHYLGSSYFIDKKVIYSVLSICIIFSLMLFDVRKLRKYGYYFLAVGILILVLLQFSNSYVNGHSVYYIGSFKLNALITIPFFFIGWASVFSNKTFKLWQFGSLFLVTTFLFANLNSLPTLFMYTAMVFVMFCQSQFSLKKRVWTTITFVIMISFYVVLLVCFYILGKIHDYQLDRLFGYLTPEKYANGSGYMYIQLQQSFSNAGWLGTKQPLQLLEPHTDLVFANLVQYYGYLIGAIIIIIFLLCIIRMATIAFAIRNPFGKLLITGSLTIFSIQAVYNIGMTLGFVPIISISLPFISYGFMPTIISSFIIGIVLSIYRRKSLLISESY